MATVCGEGLEVAGLLGLTVVFNGGFTAVLVPLSKGFFDAEVAGFLEVAANFFGACFESEPTAPATVATPA